MLINDWHKLEPFGIMFLTGEACAYNMRALLDLNERGVELITNFFGGNIEIERGTNYNSKGVASILLPYELFKPLTIFCLFSIGFYGVLIEPDGSILGVGKLDFDKYKELFEESKEYTFFTNQNYKPVDGISTKEGKNISQITGRE